MKPALSMARFGPRNIAGRGERGVALVITLILLAVITFMAVTFLVVSRSQRGAVATTTDQALARLAADAALEQAKADIIMPILANNNPFAVDMLVSTNYVNRYGFVPNVESSTNVNFDYTSSGAALNAAQQQENLGNLQFRPRVPVYMRDRQTGVTTFEYYLDINRNGRHEPTGVMLVTNSLNDVQVDSNGVPMTASFIGDPEWIGGLEFPDRRHSSTNRFTWRFAYIVTPLGQTLDLNYIHNDGRFLPLNGGDGFVRNQGVGTWELNMGAFLTDLNTNMWYSPAAIDNGWGNGYNYRPDLATYNVGAGFDDATALLRYRYENDYRTLWRPGLLFANAAYFQNDGYDTFGSGAVLNSPSPYMQDPDLGRLNRPWPGSYNTNLFYSPYDLFDRKKTGRGVTGRTITDRLQEAARRPSSYDRYTFHRLLAQLGTESPPESAKINVNYRNMENGRIIPNYETNFYSWTAVDFFTNAANHLLDNAGFAFTVTNIQIWPTNNYTPSVHRALQLAANLYDATSNTNIAPTVFRPLFRHEGTAPNDIVYISGYEEVQTLQNLTTLPTIDLGSQNDRSRIGNGGEMVWGVPFIVGAKKGFPNFNEYSMQTTLEVTRKLEFRRTGGNTAPIDRTNTMYTLSMGSVVGAEAFNSYTNLYPRNLSLTVVLQMRPWMTNQFGQVLYPFGTNRNEYGVTNIYTIPANTWRGFQFADRPEASCRIIMSNIFALMPASTFHEGSQQFVRITGQFEETGQFNIPRWFLNCNTHLMFRLIDTDLNRLVDYANLANMEETVDVADRLQRQTPEDVGACGTGKVIRYIPSGEGWAMFCTNRFNNGFGDPNFPDVRRPTLGILNQISVARGTVASTMWDPKTNATGVASFRNQFLTSSPDMTNRFYSPFNPTRDIYLFSRWQANDPLVHYTVGDLVDQGNPVKWGFDRGQATLTDLGMVNRRYEPWSQNTRASENPKRFELGLKDPLVRQSDDWDFPTNKLPNVGWLGRVHRGTPWQTVYLKSRLVETNAWLQWAGSGMSFTNKGQVKYSVVASNAIVNDTIMSLPVQDWAIPDLFTASLVDNATRGQLSINQTNLAAWSAVLAGVPVLSNLTANAQGQLLSVTNIQPNAVDGVVGRIVEGINRTRQERPDHVFKRLGEICAVPELTVTSPYITNGVPGNPRTDVVSDAVYERIPQQVLGLLRCESTPRFVVYSYGQALKPAQASILTSGGLSGLCTNYQVTAEVATRAVIRVDGAPEKPKVVVENFNVLTPD